jgi:selenocysteine lyase/cysteine desulfurase
MNDLLKFLPSLQKIHYFNYGKMSPLLEPAAKVIQELIEEAKTPFEFHAEKWKGLLESARSIVATLICADKDEIAFTESTSAGLSLIAASIPWQKGDSVIYPADEYPSNRFVWDLLKEKGVKTYPIAPEKGVSFFEQLQTLDLSRARLIAVSAVSFWDGRRHEVEKIGKFCQSKNILFSVDAIQATGAIPIDVKEWRCDFLACGGQKWLFGPIGTGFVYFRKEIIPELLVPRWGSGAVQPLKHALATEFEFLDSAKRFEIGYGDIPALFGLATSIETMKKIGWDKIRARIIHLVRLLQKGLLEIGLAPIVQGDHAGIVVIEHPDAEKIHQSLASHKFYTTLRGSRIRFSVHASTEEEQIHQLLKLL